jgi:SNF2 family DNA or RNA helicase
LVSNPSEKYFFGHLRSSFKTRLLLKYCLNSRGTLFGLPKPTIPGNADSEILTFRRGLWSDDVPVAHIDSTLDGDRVEDDSSLFYLFNTLPSPNPDPGTIADPYAKYAMCMILDSDIQGLKTTMYNYQRRSAAMMLQREVQPGQTLDPRLTCLEDQRGAKWYCEFHAGLCRIEPRFYEAARGGICAETMGLGKTLICLALILATRDIPAQIPVEYSVGAIPVRESTGSLKDMAAATVGRTATPWKNHFSDLQGGYTHDQCVEAIKKNAGHYFLPIRVPRRESRNPVVISPRKIWLTAATLVIVPANLVKQWCHEIKKHTTSLKCLVMDNKKTTLLPPEELADFDIILFSKPRFEQEAQDGSDGMGSRANYHSPLKSLHFKRLITDEGHTFGNSSVNAKTTAVTVVDFLQLDARWIVSGTPTQGLYGAEIAAGDFNSSSTIGSPIPHANEDLSVTAEGFENLSDQPEDDIASTSSKERERLFHLQERKDLEKLGNIACVYLKARPWASSFKDTASWAQHVMQPRHGSKSQGNMECLKTTLESMMIRHRPEDVEREIKLPPLYQDVVRLDGSLQDILSLNTFSMTIVSNAITSERKDADYLFHPRQRAHLQHLVSNLRQASFFWSGYEKEHITSTIDIAKDFLKKREVPVTQEDEILLKVAIEFGHVVLKNRISRVISEFHEMPMYVENGMQEAVRLAWALDGDSRNPTLMGAPMIHEAQNFVESQLWKQDPMDGMVSAGQKAMQVTLEAQKSSSDNSSPRSGRKDGKHSNRAVGSAPVLAGGVRIGDSSTLKKRSSSKPLHSVPTTSMLLPADESLFGGTPAKLAPEQKEASSHKQEAEHSRAKPKSALKNSKKTEITGTLDPSSPLTSASIVSTASAKLSYLMDRIQIHHEHEKILVFYEADNVAYYIAQALDCLGIRYLIYSKTLSAARRAQYVVTFNQTETFRVLFMEVSQAAFGLDMSSASRVYFVNPVFSLQIEAQAVKRAHRIGQTKPVYVETLVLKGSIEELILERRKNITNEEHNKMKNILDDEVIYDWIRDVRFLPIPVDDVPGHEQMAKLRTPQSVFGRGSSAILDPDADLVMGDSSPEISNKTKDVYKTIGKSVKYKIFGKFIDSSLHETEGHELIRNDPEQVSYKRVVPPVWESAAANSSNHTERAASAGADSLVNIIDLTPGERSDLPFQEESEDEVFSRQEYEDEIELRLRQLESGKGLSPLASLALEAAQATNRKAVEEEEYEFSSNRPAKGQVRFESPLVSSDLPPDFFSAPSGKGKGQQ